MADAGSSQEPPQKKARKETRKVKILFKAHGQKSCELSIYAFWLSSFEFFEAKLDRWTGDQDVDEQPIILELTSACNLQKGVQAFKKRLVAAEVDEEEHWDEIKWWRCVNGDEDSLFAAIYIFDMTLMHPYCKEVAKTLGVFQFDCPSPFGDLAKKYDEDVRCIDLSLPTGEFKPIEALNPETFAVLCQQLTDCNEFTKVRPLLDRAVAGCRDEDKHATFKHLASVELSVVKQLPPFPKFSVLLWVRAHMKTLIKKDIALARLYIDMIKVANAWTSFNNMILDLLLMMSGKPGDLSAHREALDVLQALLDTALLGRADKRLSPKFRAGIRLPVLAVASSAAQRSLMLALGADVGLFFAGNVHFVCPQQRRLLLPYTKDLSQSDLDFLSSSDLPLVD